MFRGVYTALITPFQDGEVDEETLRELTERQLAAGVDGLVPCGSTGEAATLDFEEHQRVIEVVVEAVGGRAKVLAGTGSNSTREAIRLTRGARQAGADGALMISPYYNKPTQQGIVEHYAEVARACDFPLVVYNIPGRTASKIEVDTLARLAEIEQVVGLKESTGDLNHAAHSIAMTPDDFCVLSGDDWATLPILSLGGAGVISTSSNLVPEAVVGMVRAFFEGDIARAREAHYRLLPIFDALFVESNPIPVKAAMKFVGLCEDEVRLPLTPLSEGKRKNLKRALLDFGLL